jgi:hypothetical protein
MLQTKKYTGLFPLALLQGTYFSLLALISLFGKRSKPIVLSPPDGRNFDDNVKQAFDALPFEMRRWKMPVYAS